MARMVSVSGYLPMRQVFGSVVMLKAVLTTLEYHSKGHRVGRLDNSTHWIPGIMFVWSGAAIYCVRMSMEYPRTLQLEL